MKDKIENWNFDKIWRNSYFSYYLLIRSDLLYKLLYYAIKANGYIYKCTRDKTNILPCCNYCKQIERHPTPIYKLHQNTKNLEILPTILQKVNKKPIHIIHHTHIHHTSYIAHIATPCQIKKKFLTKYLQIGWFLVQV